MKKELIHEKLIESLIVFCVVYEVKLVILQKQFLGIKTRLKKLYFVLKLIKKKKMIEKLIESLTVFCVVDETKLVILQKQF